jgi:hypothetical protein
MAKIQHEKKQKQKNRCLGDIKLGNEGFFLLSIFGYSRSGNHPQEELAKFS